MIYYNEIKHNSGKTLVAKKGSADTYRLAEMIGAIGFDKEKSNFRMVNFGGDFRVESGYVMFLNGTKVEVK